MRRYVKDTMRLCIHEGKTKMVTQAPSSEPETKLAKRRNGELPPSDLTPLVIIDRALQSGVPPDQLERMYALAERERDREDKQKFAKALARFQAECPPIAKARTSKGDAKFAFDYFSYDD